MILLDSHALVWLALEPQKLSKKAKDAISHARNGKDRSFFKNPINGLPFTTPNVIPQSLWNPVNVQLQNILYPVPTTSGCGVNTLELVPYTSRATRYSVRIDHKINDTNQLRFTFMKGELWS